MESARALSDRSGVLRAAWRRFVPERARGGIRIALREAPVRARDVIPDLLERFRATPLPPARLRFLVAGTSSRRSFFRRGQEAVAAIEEVLAAPGRDARGLPRWLDFGCGCGRVARHLARAPFVRELTGVDVDADAIAWAAANLPGTYRVIPFHPPTDLESSRFDAIYAGSVFTHFDEGRQLRWLEELHRLLRPGGLLIASTHSPSLSWNRPDLTLAQRRELSERGFVFAAGQGNFNDDSAFHSTDYLVATWGRLFGLAHFRQYGLNAYQDLTVWEKWGRAG